MELDTNKIKVATARFIDPEKGILAGYGGPENAVITSLPKVVLYDCGDKLINLFDINDETLILRRSKVYENYVVPVDYNKEVIAGLCYLEEDIIKLFPSNKKTCTLKEIEDKILSSNSFFINRKEIVDRKIKELDEMNLKKSIDEKYYKQMFCLLYIRNSDLKKHEKFGAMIQKFTKESNKQYSK